MMSLAGGLGLYPIGAAGWQLDDSPLARIGGQPWVASPDTADKTHPWTIAYSTPA
jgi:hypothetical protein